MTHSILGFAEYLILAMWHGVFSGDWQLPWEPMTDHDKKRLRIRKIIETAEREARARPTPKWLTDDWTPDDTL
jgi:hypothetical protein